MAYRSSIYEITEQTYTYVLFGREIRLIRVLLFGFKPDAYVTGLDYVSNLKKRIDAIQDQIHGNMLDASDWMKERYNVRAEKGGYMTWDLVWLLIPDYPQTNPQTTESMYYEIVTRINDIMYCD